MLDGDCQLRVNAALSLRRACPASAARVGSWRYPHGAGAAADRGVAVVDQRIHQNAGLGDVVVDLVLRPLDDWVDLDHLTPAAPLANLGIGARRGLLPANAGD